MKSKERKPLGTEMCAFFLLIAFAVPGAGSAARDEKAAHKENPKEKGKALLPAFDWTDYAEVLKTRVDTAGLVDYEGLLADHGLLDRVVDRIARVGKGDFESWSRKERIAFLINAYNALTLKVVADRYPVRKRTGEVPEGSIRQIEGVWNKIRFHAAGRSVTLDEIEHKMLRAAFGEPRIHMALVCAARGCPPLRAEPYTAARLDAQLDDQARRFLKSPARFRIDRDRGRVYLSRIFEWFGGDFLERYGDAGDSGGKKAVPGAVLNFVGRYVGEEDARYLEEGKYEVVFLEYDWSLNAEKTPKNPSRRSGS